MPPMLDTNRDMSLESDLEEIIEKEHEMRDAKRRRRNASDSPFATYVAPSTSAATGPRPSARRRSASGAGFAHAGSSRIDTGGAATSRYDRSAGAAGTDPEWHETAEERASRKGCDEKELARLLAAHTKARAVWDEADTLRFSRAKELQKAEKAARESTENYERLEADVAQADQRVSSAKEQMRWLEDLVDKSERVSASNVFADDVMEAFSIMLSNMHRASDLHGTHLREWESKHSGLQKEWDKAHQARSDCEKNIKAARDALGQAEDSVKAAQISVDRLEGQIEQIRAIVLQKEINEQSAVVVEAKEAAESAARDRDMLQAQLSEYNVWVEDLHGFFDGRAVGDSAAILRGLEDLLPPPDPLPIVIRPLLSQGEDRLDMASSTGISMRRFVWEQLDQAASQLRAKLAAQEATCQERKSWWAEAAQQLRHLEDQAKFLRAMRIRTVATPVRRVEGSRTAAPCGGLIATAEYFQKVNSASTAGPVRRWSTGSSPMSSNNGSTLASDPSSRG